MYLGVADKRSKSHLCCLPCHDRSSMTIVRELTQQDDVEALEYSVMENEYGFTQSTNL